MTIRIPVSALENSWHDAQRVIQEDMQTEQSANNQMIAAVVNNISGSGILPKFPVQNIIFNSNFLDAQASATLTAGNFDGTGINPTNQPSDSNLGNQLEVELIGSSVFGRFSTRVLIIGLDFQGNLQYDRLTFRTNEKQVTSKHYTKILSLFFNDFKGNNLCSRKFGGTIIIKEANGYQLSRDPIMASQDVEPNLFFRDYKIPGPNGPNVSTYLYNTLQDGIGSEYSVDGLNIKTTYKSLKYLNINDNTSKIGEKFKATTDNIQKITLLLGVNANSLVTEDHKFDWSGDLIISIYPLQTTVNCPTDIVPGLAIDFDPDPNPIAQLTTDQATLKTQGIILNDVLQPVDFIFSNTQVASANNNLIIPGNYYAVAIQRSGITSTGALFTAAGSNISSNSRETLFSNNVWVDVTDEDLWFQVWTDAAKLTDGQAYDAGNGIELAKTTIDSSTGATIDYQYNHLSLVNSGERVLNTGVVQAVQVESEPIQDELTGNPVYSRQRYEPTFSFLTNSSLATLEETSEPLLVGSMMDINPKNNSFFSSIQKYPGLSFGDNFCIISPTADLLSANLIGSLLTPDHATSNLTYKIFKSTLCVDGYGDVNGDGYIDELDIVRCSSLIGESLSFSSTQQKINDGYISTLELLRADVDGDGKITANDLNLITNFVNKKIYSFPVGGTFNHLCLQVQPAIGRWDGYYDCNDGYVQVNGQVQTGVPANTLDPFQLMYDGYFATPDIAKDNLKFYTVPYLPLTYDVTPQPFWQDNFLVVNADTRLTPASFTYPERVHNYCVENSIKPCKSTVDIVPELNIGRNDIMYPDNLIIGRGQLLRPDGNFYKIDYEVGTVVLELPAYAIDGYSVNIFEKFVAETGGLGSGMTIAGYSALKFADCSYVQPDALSKNQVRWSVSIQSYLPNADGYTVEDGYGIIVDDVIGVFMDYMTGILTLSIKDIDVNPLYLTAVTRIQVNVFLKKGGFNNKTIIVTPERLWNLFSK